MNGLVVTADTHIDHGRWGGRSDGPVDTAWQSAARCLEAVATEALERGAGLVIAGDLFLHGNPLPEAVELVADQVRRVQAAGLPVVVQSGNHDQDRVPIRQRLVVERFADLGAIVVTEPGVTILDDGTQIASLPWFWRSRMVADLGLGHATADEIDDIIADEMTAAVEDLAGQVDPARGPVVLAGHAVLSEATIAAGRRASEMALRRHLREPVLPIDTVIDGPWTTAVFGHVHSRQSFADGRIWIPGSPDRIDFGDEHHDKGGLWVGPDGTVDVFPTPARRMLTLRNAGDLDALDEAVLVRAMLPDDALDLPEDWRRAINDSGARLATVTRPRRKPRDTDTADDAPTGESDVQFGIGANLGDLVRRWADKRGLDDVTTGWLEQTATDLAA